MDGGHMLKAVGSRLTYANVVATGAMFVALGGGAYALSGVPDRGGVFHGCVSKKTGALRVVAGAKACRKAKQRHGRVVVPGEFAIAWNQRGNPGQNGAHGTNGTNGVNGATQLVVRTKAVLAGHFGALVPCGTGERAVSGGVARTDGSSSSTDSVERSAPAIVEGGGSHVALPGETPNAWAVSLNNAGLTASFTV